MNSVALVSTCGPYVFKLEHQCICIVIASLLKTQEKCTFDFLVSRTVGNDKSRILGHLVACFQFFLPQISLLFEAIFHLIFSHISFLRFNDPPNQFVLENSVGVT